MTRDELLAALQALIRLTDLGSGGGTLYVEEGKGAAHIVASLDFGYVNGKRKRPRRYQAIPDVAGMSARDAKRAIDGALKGAIGNLEQLRRERDGGLPANLEKQTVGEYLEWWLREVVQMRLRATTYVTYSGLVAQHIVPAVGHVRLKALRPQHVREMLNRMKRDELSTSMVRQARAVLHRAMQQAVEDEALDRNPVTIVKVEREERRRRPTLDVEGVRTLLQRIHGDRLEAMFIVAVTTGLRKGELRGLRWSDVDLDGRQAIVRAQLQRVVVGAYEDGHPKAGKRRWDDVFLGLKSGGKPRAVGLSDAAVAALKRHLDQQSFERRQAGKLWAKHEVNGKPTEWGLVFCRADGAPLDGAWISRWFAGHLTAAGIEHVRWHDLRHTMATLLATHGVAPAAVRDALGHSSITMTMDVYTERVADGHRMVASAMDGLLLHGSADSEADAGSEA